MAGGKIQLTFDYLRLCIEMKVKSTHTQTNQKFPDVNRFYSFVACVAGDQELRQYVFSRLRI